MLNLVIVLALTFLIALVLIYFISLHDKKRSQVLVQKAEDKSDEPDLRTFMKQALGLCENLKLTVDSYMIHSSTEFSAIVSTQNPVTKVKMMVVGILNPPDHFVDNLKIMNISDEIISERLSKGIIITTGVFDPLITRAPELAPIEFIDGKRFKDLLKEYQFLF